MLDRPIQQILSSKKNDTAFADEELSVTVMYEGGDVETIKMSAQSLYMEKLRSEFRGKLPESLINNFDDLLHYVYEDGTANGSNEVGLVF